MARFTIAHAVKRAVLPAIAAILLLTGASRPAEAHFHCRLWIIPSAGATASPPVPAGIADATFETDHLSFFMEAPSPGAYWDDGYFHNTVGSFIDSANPVSRLAFSGRTNKTLKRPVTAATRVTDSTYSKNGTYALYFEFYGRVGLVHNQIITVLHDDGVSLYIDGVEVPGFDSGSTVAKIDRTQFTGSTGSHDITLYYTQTGGAAILSFSPEM